MPPRLGEFELLLLLALDLLGEGAHGGAIRELVAERAHRPVAPGAVYTALDRLERRRFVTSWLGDPLPRRGGKRRRHYRLEEAGRAAARQARAAVAQLTRTIASEPQLP